jgi:PKD repeat protein
MIKKIIIKKYLEIGLVISFFLILIPFIPSASAEEITLNFTFPEPEINQVNISNNISDYITMADLTTYGYPNLPLLPIKPLKILLPQKGVLESINVSHNGKISLGNEYNVTTGTYPWNNYSSMEYNNSNESYYNFSVPYPTTSYSLIGKSDFLGYSILEFNLYPVYYIKNSGEIYYYENMTVTIITNESGAVSPLFRGLEVDKMDMHKLVDDFSMEDTYVSYPTHSHSSIVDPSESYDYVIITVNRFINAPHFPPGFRKWYAFQDLADYKNDTGVINANIVTVNEIENDPYYWGSNSSSLDDCNDTQSQIRNFISDAYYNWETRYVLLGGDTFFVPVRKLFYTIQGVFEINGIVNCSSDLYYSCIYGPFNNNNDNYWGRFGDGEGGGEVNLMPAVWVGRACVTTLREVNNFVNKTLTYEKTKDNDPYLENILLVGQLLDKRDDGFWVSEPSNWGDKRKQKIADDILGERDYEKLYDGDFWHYAPPRWNVIFDGWKKHDIKQYINNNEYSILNSDGHGITNVAMRLNSLDTVFLTNHKPFFLYSNACFAGAFDNVYPYDADNDPAHDMDSLKNWSDCFAEYLNVKTRYGAFAVIMNSRFGWYNGNIEQDIAYLFDRQFFEEVYLNHFTILGEALGYSKLNLGYLIEHIYGNFQPVRDTYYELNLFGDPQLALKIPTDNNDPDKPDKPQGYANPLKTHWTYTTSTTDLDTDSVYYNWEWDGQQNPIWWGPYDSEGTVTRDHTWLTSDTHSVRVRAKDQFGAISDWSDYNYSAVSFNSDILINSNPVVVNHEVNLYGQAESGEQWIWDFGQGRGTQYQQNATQTYNTTGEFTVNLTVINDLNISSNITKTIKVVLLKSDFTSSSLYSAPNEMISFNDTSDGYYTIANWSWDFDENSTSFSRNASYEYETEGVYEVSLTVKDAFSNTNTSRKTIYIDSTPPEITAVSSNPQIVGYKSNICISVNLTDEVSGIKTAQINITYPDNVTDHYPMDYSDNNIYEYTFNDTWDLGGYEYTIWTIDNANNTNSSTEYSFSVSRYFGKNVIGSFNQSILDTITGSVFTVREKSVANSIIVYLDPGNATTDSHYRCAIYRHNDSMLLNISEEKNITSGKGWRIFNFSAPKPVLMNDTEYVLSCWSDNYTVNMYYSNGSINETMYNINGSSPLRGHYFEGMYNYTPESINFEHENRNYSIYCQYTPDYPPEIANVSGFPDTVGLGFNVTITADATDNVSGVKLVKIQIIAPNNNSNNYTMTHVTGNTYQYIFTDTWIVGTYDYTILVTDNAYNTNSSTGHSFDISAQATIGIATLKDSYEKGEYIEITDPPFPPENLTLVARGLTWNEYYDNTSRNNMLESFTEPVNYQNDNGIWIPINRTFHQLGTNHPAYTYGYRVGNDHGLYSVYFKTNAQNSWPVAFAYNKSDDPTVHVIRSKLVGVGYLDPSMNWSYKYLQSVQSSQAQFSGNEVIYMNAFTGTDVRWSYGNTELKEEIILGNATKTLLENRPPSTYNLSDNNSYLVFITKMEYQGLTPHNISGLFTGNITVSAGGIDFRDILGQFRCSLPMGEAYELSNQSMRYPLVHRILQYHGNYYLLSGLKASTLTSMTFPVVVDPTLTVNTTTSDGYLYKPNSNYTEVWSLSEGMVSSDDEYISIGQRKTTVPSEYYIYRGSLFFDTSMLPTNACITNATLSLYKKDDYSATDFTITVQNGQPTYPHDPLEYGDYDKEHYLGNGGGLNTTNFVNGRNNITLTNFSWIAAGDVTKLCLRSSRDIDGIAPTGEEYVNVCSANLKEESNPDPRPKLIVIYQNQSKIKNTGETNISGYLLIQVQFFDDSQYPGDWIVDHDTINETSLRVISVGEQLGLDMIFNGLVTTDDLSRGSGLYRVYAALRDPDGNILITSDEVELAAWYEFEVNL